MDKKSMQSITYVIDWQVAAADSSGVVQVFGVKKKEVKVTGAF